MDKGMMLLLGMLAMWLGLGWLFWRNLRSSAGLGQSEVCPICDEAWDGHRCETCNFERDTLNEPEPTRASALARRNQA